ncbi:linalool dehydratase/isomerase domain-containing protein [Variovorax ginsengisoli]|uniref:Linalool dehydratase/isomerase domain-containing protein n=1 Tax=Variovorax ginsengisoli TaxID=363844 RepID=A0ABT9SA54_9BURK|nr:hypothetical protein [Variovorax ginsengisoli]MDP9901085.1 hypothetical protein [Variovorax ginsengisoli]
MNAPDTLTDRQVGHLRHFANLSRQLPNDWSLMQGRGTGQDDFGGYRFQLAYMAYAMALAHRHRLPAAPGVFKPVFERLIEKMLLPEVWMYWARVSQGGSVFNMHLSDKLKEEWDPVGRDNIMYSAYVQSMALLYNYLFDDERYAAPGALTFSYWSFFWGGKERRFEHDQNSLNDTVYWQMVESGYLGVACEPNCVFQICNQPAILGFRMHDLVNGNAVAAEVTQAYLQAWAQFGQLGANGHYNMMLAQDTRAVRDNAGMAPWVDAWCGTLMNMWNRDFVHDHYPAQIRDWLVNGPDGALSVRSSERPLIMGQKVVNDDSDFGWAATWASEMGDQATLDGLMCHADRYMAPAWRDGGVYFPRNDTPHDADGNRTLMEPMCGNVLMGYASLNVPDGLWKLYNEPISPDERRQPALVEVGAGVDVLKARFDPERNQLHFTVRRCASSTSGFNIMIGRLVGSGRWTLSMDGRTVAQGTGAHVADTSLMALRAGQGGLLLDCSGATAATVFLLAFQVD